MTAASNPDTDPAQPPAGRRFPFMRTDTRPNLKKGVAGLRLGLAVAAVLLLAVAIFGNTFIRGMAAGIVVFAVLFFGGFLVVVRKKAKAVGRPSLQPPPLPMARWDYAMSAHDMEGTPAPFADVAGSVLVLNFWATWCGPCIREMPGLEELRDATADLDVRFACVTSEDADHVRSFLEKRSWSLPVYLLEDEAPECFRTRAIPATFILDRSGRIALRHIGAAAWDDDAVVSFVRRLAAPSNLDAQPAVDG